MKNLDILIIGGGIVGLASAYQLIKSNPDLRICVLEKEKTIGCHQTGNNSGVIHSGVYYKPDSFKARNCIEGKKELIAFCENNGIPIQKKGKVIVATKQDQIPHLELIENRGRANGIRLDRVGFSRLREIEPNLHAIDGLWVPDVSIVSFKQVAEVLALEFQKLGGQVCFNERVERVHTLNEQSFIQTPTNEYTCRCLINCAGLFSDRIAKMCSSQKLITNQIIPFRGEYYQLKESKKHLIKGLIYPVPDPRFPFLGVHFTPMMNGNIEAGPNAVLAFAREGYKKTDINLRDMGETFSYVGFWKMAAKYWKAGLYETARSMSKKLFVRDLQKLVPSLVEEDLCSGGAGVRAQVVSKNGKLVDDFCIEEEGGLIHVINAPSPAATASFAIGKQIAKKALNQLNLPELVLSKC